LLSQGADGVFVIDDESDDGTDREACVAGAEVVSVRSSGTYAEQARYARIQQLIKDQTAVAGGDVWWVIADADEFPRGPSGLSIRDLVERLPEWVDVVGSRVLEHYPSGRETYCPRSHPLRCYPLARWYNNPYCQVGHWKHQLLRVRWPEELLPLPGHHTAVAEDGRPLREFGDSLLMHHFPFRDRERTEMKLRRAGAPGGRYAGSPDSWLMPRLNQRLAMLENLYTGRFDLIPNSFPGEPLMGITVSDWRGLVSPEEAAWAAVPATLIVGEGSAGPSRG
jgi:hypothetical protein